MHLLTTRDRAEPYLRANPTPSQEKLVRFLTHKPRVLPVLPPAQTRLSPGLLKATLTLLGAVLLGVVGACLHH